MHLAVFGATGRTGRHLVSQALNRGHTVTAFVRSRDKLAAQQDLADDRLRVVEGDVQDAEAVARAVEGADAVLLALGHTKSSEGDILTAAARNVVAAMQRHGVRRIVTEIGAGVSLPGEERSFGGRLMVGVMKLVAGGLLEDAQRHTDLVAQSGLEWTVVRPPRLTDAEPRGDYRHGALNLGPGASIARADVADFMLREAEQPRYLGAAPNVSY